MARKHSISNKFGYSFLEMLVAVTILGIITVTFARLFTASIIGEKKTKNLETIKQNGNYVLTVVADMIRNAKEITVPPSLCQPAGAGSSNITIKNQDLSITLFECVNPVPGTHQISSNGAGLIANDQILIEDCTSVFTCVRPARGPDVVKIDFTLRMGESTDVREFVRQRFQTTVSLRSYE